jgi:acyl-CoA synthetase (AMP-forming)/AMP-acid ligase II
MLHTIQDYVDHQAQERPDAVYLVAPETGHTLTFAGLQRSSRRLANYLAALGIGPGETVALLTHNGYQGPRLLIGAMYGGRCIAPLNLLAQPSQLEYVLDHCDARIVFASPDQVERLNGVLGNIAREIKIVACDVDAEEFIDAPDTAQRRASVAAEDDALMVYTSGTTGRPKGVILAHRSAVAGGRFVSEAHRLTPSDRAMAVLPLYHINAQIVTAAAPLVHGGSLVLPHRFSASTFWEQVVRHGCTWINCVPTIIAYLVNGSDPKEQGLDIRRVRFCRSASAPLPPSQHRAFEQKFGIGVIETMGLTETAAPCFTNPLDAAKRKIGSPGQAFGNEARIVDAGGNTLPPGETGEILVRGPNVMKGYYKDADETAKVLRSDGWLHTGDLGHMDEDGFVFVTGRIKELIIKGGENIPPREIDEVLLSHPAILEAAAVGIPDESYGQEIMACIVTKPGARCTGDELRAFCRKELGAYKTPKIFRFLEELPKGPSGKVQRRKLVL